MYVTIYKGKIIFLIVFQIKLIAASLLLLMFRKKKLFCRLFLVLCTYINVTISSLYLISKDLCKYDIIRIFGIVIYSINIILLKSFYRNRYNLQQECFMIHTFVSDICNLKKKYFDTSVIKN